MIALMTMEIMWRNIELFFHLIPVLSKACKSKLDSQEWTQSKDGIHGYAKDFTLLKISSFKSYRQTLHSGHKAPMLP